MAVRHHTLLGSPKLSLRRRHGNGVIFIIWTYIALFLTASGILLASVWRVPYQNDSQRKLPLQLYDKLSIADQKHFEAFGWPYKDVEMGFNCSWLSEAHLEYLATGWTKSVYSVKLRNQSFAMKTVNPNGEDVSRCIASETMRDCYEKASSKLLKEVILSRELQHPNIVKVLGWCISEYNVAMVTELCEPFKTISLLTMPFSLRLKVSLDIARLVHFLSISPLGSIALNDFRAEQFLLCEGTLKLTDLDDVGVEEPRCRSQEDCKAGQCLSNACVGSNEFHNVLMMIQKIIGFTLAYDTPVALRTSLSKLLVVSENVGSYYILKQIEKVVDKFCKRNKRCW